MKLKGRERTIASCANLAEETLEVVSLEPSGGALNTFDTDGAGDASVRGTRAVTVEVLVHLDGNVVVRVLDRSERSSIARRGPGCENKPGQDCVSRS